MARDSRHLCQGKGHKIGPDSQTTSITDSGDDQLLWAASPKPLGQTTGKFSQEKRWLKERVGSDYILLASLLMPPGPPLNLRGPVFLCSPHSFKLHLAPLGWQLMSFCPQCLNLVPEIPQPYGQAMQQPDWAFTGVYTKLGAVTLSRRPSGYCEQTTEDWASFLHAVLIAFQS